jgi:hypothetical protein
MGYMRASQFSDNFIYAAGMPCIRDLSDLNGCDDLDRAGAEAALERRQG